MFCCRRAQSFSPSHDLDEVVRRKLQGSRREVNTNVDLSLTKRNHRTNTTDGDLSIEDAKKPEKNPVYNSITFFQKSKQDVEGKLEIEGRREGYRGKKVDANTQVPSHPKSKLVAEVIKCAILNNQFLHDIIPDHVIDQVVEAMAPRDVKSNEIIIEQGALGDQFFVNERGSYIVIVDKQIVKQFETPSVFGELAVLYQQRRAATVQACTEGRIWMIDDTLYNALMIKDACFEEKQRERFLGDVRTVQECSGEKLRQIAKLLKTTFYPAHATIVRQGDVGDKFCIIKAGSVTVVKDGVVVATLQESDYFGEKALTGADVRQATCTADPPGVTCYELTRHEFIDHLGDFESFLMKRPSPRDTAEVQRPEQDHEKICPSLNQLEKVVTIGEGGFGRVMLVKLANTERYYALKLLSRAEHNSEEQKAHVTTEKAIHKLCNSHFIVQLYTTYVDSRYLYFLMEACMGGDLFSRMQRQKGRCFVEDHVRFLAGCIVEALSYLHSRNFIYRDLKPENMLIDALGYIKLADFGFAKILKPTESTYTFAGTPEYVAPEVIYNKGHNRQVDYWALGIFIFELIAGKTPFKSNDPSYMVTYGLILKGIDYIQFPKQVSKHASNLIKRLCRLTPHERLGCQKGGIQDIRNHKWFQPLQWQHLQQRKLPSEFKPKLEHAFDTTYFEEYDEDYPDPPIDNDVFWEDF